MTHEQYIEAVKVKLEEISPFDEPKSFIASDDESANIVKPITSYIEQSITEAVHNCLKYLPITLLHADIERTQPTMQIDDRGVGIISVNPLHRFVRFRHAALRRDITAFISSEDPLYLLQQNPYTRGGISKPVAVLASNQGGEDYEGNSVGQLEIYSFPPSFRNTSDNTGILLSINTDKHASNESNNEYIRVMESSDIYHPLTSADSNNYNGVTYGFRVEGTWYRGWRNSNGGESLFTLGNAVPTSGDVVYRLIDNGAHITGAYTVKEHKDKYVDISYIKSPIGEYIVLECASIVSDILNDTNTAQRLRNEIENKLKNTLS